MLPVAAISITDILANIYFVYGIYLYMDKYYIYFPACIDKHGVNPCLQLMCKDVFILLCMHSPN